MIEKNLKINLLLDYYGEMLTNKQREVMDFYYNEDLSLSEISEHVNVTRQGVHDLIKRSEASLMELDEKLRFVSRFDEIRIAANEIEEALSTAKRLNSGNIYLAELEGVISRLSGALLILRQDEPKTEV